MSDQRKPASPRKRPSRAKKVQLEGEVTYIDVPRPPASSLNPRRPANALILAQVEHMHQAEKNRVAKHRLSGVHPDKIRTEGEAAAYIQQVTRLLHPAGKKRNRKKATPRTGA